MHAERLGGRISDVEQMNRGRGLGKDETAMRIRRIEAAAAAERVLFPRPRVFPHEQAANLRAVGERRFLIDALPRNGDFHLPELSIRRETTGRLPPRFPARPRIADGRLEHHVVFRTGEISQVLKENILPIRRMRAGIDPDFVAVIEDDFRIVAPLLAKRLDHAFPIAQQRAHGDVEMIGIPHHVNARLPRAHLGFGGLQGVDLKRVLPFGAIDDAVDLWRGRREGDGEQRRLVIAANVSAHKSASGYAEKEATEAKMQTTVIGHCPPLNEEVDGSRLARF